MKREKIVFTASLPPIQGAVRLDGNGDGARVQFDIPRENMAQAMQLILLAGQTFTVTVAPE